MTPEQRLVLEKIDRSAHELEELHRGCQLAYAGLLAFALDSNDANAPYERTRLEKAVLSRANGFVEQMEREIERNASELLVIGSQNSGPLDASKMKTLRELSSAAVSAATARITQGVALDGEATVKAFRTFQFEVSLVMAGGKTRSQAFFSAKQGKVGGLKFDRVDRAGRKWPSTRQTLLTSRGLFLSAYVEASVFATLSRGEDTMYVDYSDSDHENHGMAFSITGSDATKPAYLDIREGIWHPNARVLVSIQPPE